MGNYGYTTKTMGNCMNNAVSHQTPWLDKETVLHQTPLFVCSSDAKPLGPSVWCETDKENETHQQKVTFGFTRIICILIQIIRKMHEIQTEGL